MKEFLAQALSSPKNRLILFGLVFLTGITAFNVYVNQRPEPLQPTTNAQRVGQAQLSLEPSQIQVKKGESFTLSLQLDPQGEILDAVDAILVFDPKMLKVESLEKGELFPAYPVQVIDNEKGQVQLSAFAIGENEVPAPLTQAGSLGKLRFQALSLGTTSIRFSTDSIAASQGRNVLNATQEARVEVQP